jgi:phosphatidate phosphatase APP1
MPGALRHLLSTLARPVSRAKSRRGIALLPYRGYGSQRELFLIGRVFRQAQGARRDRQLGMPGVLRNILRRITRHAITGIVVTARFAGAEQRVETDADGYFRVHLQLAGPPPADKAWHDVALALDGEDVSAVGKVFIPPPDCRFVLISDIDDTVVETGVANKLLMMWRLFVADAKSRVAFPGVAALYRAMHDGLSGADQNPMLYVSRAPWGTYDVLDEFFNLHGIPVGPVLFLREWGVSWTSPLPRRAEEHKEDLIRHMLAFYPDKPFVLVGDSGQLDPEVYARIVASHPGRVLTVMIRDVTDSARRAAGIAHLAEAVIASGSRLLLARDSLAMARHAVELGLIPPAAVPRVEEDRRH